MLSAATPLAHALVAGATLCVAALSDHRPLRWAYILTAAAFAFAAVTSIGAQHAPVWR